MNENVNVCITPKGEKPVLHFSQFDNERVFTVTVLADDGESAAVLTGLGVEFRLRKTDSHVVTIAPESVADNVITFKTTEQMCACCGQNIASVVLMKDDLIISTLDILVDIQRDILSGGLTSESDIRNLTTQIEQIVPEVIGDDYYNKQEVDDLLAEHTFDPSNYYNKSDVDGLLDDKADADDVYTKTETDNLLSAKMNNIGYNGIVDDVPIISFNTDCAAPLDIIKGKIDPDPNGVSALNVTRTGKNLCFDAYGNKASESTYLYPSGDNLPIVVNNSLRSAYAYVGKNQDVVVSFASAPQRTIAYGLEAYPSLGIICHSLSVTALSSTSFKLNSGNYNYIAFYYCNDLNNIPNNCQIELGNQASTYEPYNGQTSTVNLGQSVTIGGVIDLINGKVTLTDDTEISVTPVTVSSIAGANNIFLDTGNLTQIAYFEGVDDNLNKLIKAYQI